jgi:hypothetical protein
MVALLPAISSLFFKSIRVINTTIVLSIVVCGESK